jgi:predicted RNA polymerase sigma factor
MQKAPPPADDPDAVRGDLQRQLDALDERRAARDEAFAVEKKREEVASIRRQNCETAQKNLAKLRQGGNKAYMTPEGEVIRLTDEERARRIEDAKQGFRDNCEE